MLRRAQRASGLFLAIVGECTNMTTSTQRTRCYVATTGWRAHNNEMRANFFPPSSLPSSLLFLDRPLIALPRIRSQRLSDCSPLAVQLLFPGSNPSQLLAPNIARQHCHIRLEPVPALLQRDFSLQPRLLRLPIRTITSSFVCSSASTARRHSSTRLHTSQGPRPRSAAQP